MKSRLSRGNFNLHHLLPTRETIAKTTAGAAFLLSAVFGAHKMYEGFTPPAATGFHLQAGGELTSEALAETASTTAQAAKDTFINLSLGVLGLATAGMIGAGAVMRQRSLQARQPAGFAFFESYECSQFPEDAYDGLGISGESPTRPLSAVTEWLGAPALAGTQA